MIKLAILYEALEQVRSGKAHFDDRIVLNKADQVQGSGVLLFLDTLGRFVRCELAEPAAGALAGDAALCQIALKMLNNQFYRTAIPRYLYAMPGATGDSIANKTGALDAVRNDVAAISTKNGMVLLSVFTFNNQDHSWTEDQEAELTIAEVARAVVEDWSPQGAGGVVCRRG